MDHVISLPSAAISRDDEIQIHQNYFPGPPGENALGKDIAAISGIHDPGKSKILNTEGYSLGM